MRILILFFLLPLVSMAQHAVIKGVAPLSIGQEIQLRVNDDPITGKERVLASQQVDVDGSFELKVVPNGAQYAILQVGRNCADFYMERDKDLELSFVPPADDPLKPKAFNERKFFMPKITGGSGKKLNDEILAFNDSLDAFLESIYPMLKQRRSPKFVAEQVAFFERLAARVFADAQPFTKEYIKYSIGGIEQTFLTDRERLYEKYLKDTKPTFDNPAFTSFLIQYYQGTVFNLMVIDKHEECVKAFKTKEAIANIDKLLLEAEPKLKDVSLRRLVLIEGLDRVYGQKDFEDERMNEELRRFGMLSSNSYIGSAARNMADKHSNLVVGSKVPELLFNSKDGSPKKLSELYGQYMFLELTDATNVYSNRETNVIPNLKSEFKLFRFLTICVGNTEAEMQALKRKMKIDWELGRIDLSNPAIEDFRVKSLPQFFIIDPKGTFYAVPAKDPTKGAQQELMSLNEKLKAKNRGSVGK